MGRMKREGWWRKVLSILQCQVEKRAVTRPGISTVKMGKIIAEVMFSRGPLSRKTKKAARYFPMRVKRLAEKMRKNLQEKSRPSGSILQGPILKAFDKPKPAVRKDVAYVTAKRTWSLWLEPTISDNEVGAPVPVDTWESRMLVKIAVVGMASQ